MDSLYRIPYFLSGPILTAPSQFEVGSSFAMVSDPVSEAVAFFTGFDQRKVNDLDPVDFLGCWVSLC